MYYDQNQDVDVDDFLEKAIPSWANSPKTYNYKLSSFDIFGNQNHKVFTYVFVSFYAANPTIYSTVLGKYFKVIEEKNGRYKMNIQIVIDCLTSNYNRCFKFDPTNPINKIGPLITQFKDFSNLYGEKYEIKKCNSKEDVSKKLQEQFEISADATCLLCFNQEIDFPFTVPVESMLNKMVDGVELKHKAVLIWVIGKSVTFIEKNDIENKYYSYSHNNNKIESIEPSESTSGNIACYRFETD